MSSVLLEISSKVLTRLVGGTLRTPRAIKGLNVELGELLMAPKGPNVELAGPSGVEKIRTFLFQNFDQP